MSVLLQGFLMVLLAEMGDKSQFLMAALTARYRLPHILVGAALAIAVLNLLAVTVGGLVGAYLPTWLVSLAAGVAFFLFARAGLQGPTDEEEQPKTTGRRAIPSVFFAYFLSELGDKTQLTTVALAADAKMDPLALLCVFVGTCAGLLLAGVLGVVVGTLLGTRLPQGVFAVISSVLFFACGIVKLLDGFENLFAGARFSTLWTILATLAPTLVFLTLCIIERTRHGKANAGSCQSLSKQ